MSLPLIHPTWKLGPYSSLIPDYEISSILDMKLARRSTASYALAPAYWPPVYKTKQKVLVPMSEMTLNFRMIVERHPNWTEWLTVWFLAVKLILLDEKLVKWSNTSCIPEKEKKTWPYMFVITSSRVTWTRPIWNLPSELESNVERTNNNNL